MIRKRKLKKGYGFQVRLNKKGMAEISKTFTSRKDAQRYEREQLILIDQCSLQHKPVDLAKWTLRKMIDKYKETHLPMKKGALTEQIVLDCLCRTEAFVDSPIIHVTPEVINAYKNRRLQTVAPATFNRQLCVIQHIFSVAKTEWKIPIDNPCCAIKKPTVDNKRDRLVTNREHKMIMNSAGYELKLLYELFIETALRKSELLSVLPEHVQGRKLVIPKQKTKRRVVPLSERAEEILRNELRPPFKITVSGLTQRWGRLMKKLQIIDLHIQDLRHVCLTNLAKKSGMTTAHLMVVSGHTNLKTLGRYTNLTADDVLEITRPEKENIKAVK